MVKKQLIELVSRHIKGNDSSVDRKYQADKRIIELDIAAAFNTIIYTIFKKEPSNLGRYTKKYKNVAIVQDPDTLKYYAILPATVIQFPTPTDGIWKINEMQGRDISFVAMDKRKNEMFYESEFQSIDNVIEFSLSSNIVDFENHDPDITEVLMDLVVTFTEWDDDEDVPLPAGQDLNIVNIVRELSGLRPIDKLNNQNPVT
jgi:hypothetical protein